MANKTIRDFHGSFNVSESYTTYKSEDQIDEATPPSGPKNPDKPHVGKTAHEKKVERYQQYLAKKKRDREQHLRNNPGLTQNRRQPVSQNAFYSKRAFRNQEINASYDPDLSESDKSEYSKLMKQYGDMPMSKVPMKTRMRIRELGRKIRGDKPVSGLRASDLVDDMKRRQMGEAKSDRLEKIARAAAAREKDQAAQKEKAKEKHYAASKKSREAVKHFGNKDQFGRVREDIEQVDELNLATKVKAYAKRSAQAAGERDDAPLSGRGSEKSAKKSEKLQSKADRMRKMIAKKHGKNIARHADYQAKAKSSDRTGGPIYPNVVVSPAARTRNAIRAKAQRNEEIEQVDEAKMGAIANAARKGMPPYTIVAIQGLNPPKVVAQETTMIASAVPAHVKEMNSKYPKAKISVEGKSGKILHTEQVEESMIGRTKPSRELNVQKFEKKYLGTKSLKDAKRAAHKAERKKGKQDIQKGD